LKGGLPWQGVKAKTRTEKYEIIKNMKVNTPIKELVKMKIDSKTKLPIMQQQSEQI
jgi:hypothetical protein